MALFPLSRQRRTLLLVATAAAILLRWHRWLAREAATGRSARLIRRSSAGRGGLADTLGAIIERCASLRSPGYVPTPWASGQLANMILFEAKIQLQRWVLGTKTSRQRIETDLFIDWWDDDATRRLQPTAPCVIFLHTINGGDHASDDLCMRAASRRGWRSCCFVRRGHAGPLEGTPTFSLLGDVDDVRAQVAAVAARWPDADFVGMVGVSAGSGLVVSYLGQAGDSTPVDAGASLCPAWDLRRMFDEIKVDAPIADALLTWSCKRYFVSRNDALLRSFSAAAVERCLAARTLQELFVAHAPFANRDAAADGEAAFGRHNPISYVTGIRVPLLIVNAADDIVCRPSNIREDLVASQDGVALLRTERGGHIAFCEGWLGEGSYVRRLRVSRREVGGDRIDLPDGRARP